MKRWIVLICFIFLAFIGGVYIFIPNVLVFKNAVTVNATQRGLQRVLLDKESVAKWWPGENKQGLFYLNNYNYRIHENVVTVLPITIENKNISINSTLLTIPLREDSLKLEWVAKTISSYNPIKRFTAYLEAKKLNRDMAEILVTMKRYYSLPEHIYGCNIQRELVMDDNLIYTLEKSDSFPNTAFIYRLINQLRNYAEEKKTKAADYPMFNVDSVDGVKYLVKAALPVENQLAGSGKISSTTFLKGGNILVATVQGGYLKCSEVLAQMQKYIDDYEMSQPTIPFYSLVTDRMKETDSAKWITKVYYPVR